MSILAAIALSTALGATPAAIEPPTKPTYAEQVAANKEKAKEARARKEERMYKFKRVSQL